MVMCLLKGTNKGVRSLVEESLTITREMLREAQLAYPRNPVRDKISVAFGHIPVSFVHHPITLKWSWLKLWAYFWLITSGMCKQVFLKSVAITDICHLFLQVLHNLKSKTLDLACALQTYMHYHIAVSLNNAVSYKCYGSIVTSPLYSWSLESLGKLHLNLGDYWYWLYCPPRNVVNSSLFPSNKTWATKSRKKCWQVYYFGRYYFGQTLEKGDMMKL